MATMTTSWMQRGRTGGLVALLALACCAEEESPTSGGGCGLTSYSDEFIGSNDPSSSAAICMPRSFAVNAVGHAPCVVIEGRRDDTCTCDGFRRAVPTEHAAIADELAN